MRYFKLIITLFLFLSILFSLCSPVFADDVASSEVSSFWDVVCMAGQNASDSLVSGNEGMWALGSVLRGFAHNGAVCAQSDDHLHHANSSTTYGSGSDDDGAYITYMCSYCGELFNCYASDFEQAYSDYVDTLPAEGYSSDGKIIWTPTADDISNYYFDYGYFSSTSIPAAPSFSCSIDCSCSYWSQATRSSYDTGFSASITCPMNGVYTQIPSIFVTQTQCHSSYPSYSLYFNSSSFTVNSGSLSYRYTTHSYFDWSGFCPYIAPGQIVTYYLPSFYITPSSSSDSSGTAYSVTYAPTTRVNNISFDLGTYDNSTETYNVTNNVTVVNETTNIFTDPGTGTQYPISSWDYDYADRKYNLVLVNGDATVNATVEFGVDELTIDLGGNSSEYSYMIETHTHDYVASITTAPTCTSPGVKTYSCSVCNDSYTESISALGHDFVAADVEPFTYILDSSSVLCPECDSDDVTCSQSGTTSTFNCLCNDCSHSWNLTGSALAGRTKYVCSRCQAVTYEDIGEDEDNSDIPYWHWLQQWLIRFKEWLGQKLDGLSSGSSGSDIDLDTGNTFDIDSYDTDITYQYTDEDGEDQEFEIKDLFKKFAFVKDIWTIGKTLMTTVTNDAAAAAAYDSDFAFLGADEEAAPASDAAADAPQTDGSSLLVNGVPTLNIDLSAAESHYGFDYGGEVAFLDLSWYTPYKTTVDNILSGFLWLLFCWRLFKNAPSIISGGSFSTEKLDDIDAGKKKH